MNPRRLSFRVESRERKLLGVCAGIGRSTRIDPTFVRIAYQNQSCAQLSKSCTFSINSSP